VDLTNYEKMVLYGVVKYPMLNGKKIAEKLNIKQSTVAVVKKKLKDMGYYRTLSVPMVQNFGAEMMVIIHTNFNPVIPLEKRIGITEKKIEAADEIFFSMGEEEKGFSLSFTENYTGIGKINDIRAKTFGKLGLLDKEYPKEVVFPFQISKVYRFFNFAPLMGMLFNIAAADIEDNFFKKKNVKMTNNEKTIFCAIIEHPDSSLKMIADTLYTTRQTVGKLKKKFKDKNYMRAVTVPDFNKLGLEILSFYHVIFDPRNSPDFEKDELKTLLNDEIIFFATRQFECVAISMHENYERYRMHKMFLLQRLKEKGWEPENYTIRSFSLNKARIIKDFTFAPIAKKVLNC
jgi:DNA-binding MarR family transcriptional regulator